ncbi:hypothetical protein NDU88_003945, partial [Pleurodeles waltl]
EVNTSLLDRLDPLSPLPGHKESTPALLATGQNQCLPCLAVWNQRLTSPGAVRDRQRTGSSDTSPPRLPATSLFLSFQ